MYFQKNTNNITKQPYIRLANTFLYFLEHFALGSTFVFSLEESEPSHYVWMLEFSFEKHLPPQMPFRECIFYGLKFCWEFDF